MLSFHCKVKTGPNPANLCCAVFSKNWCHYFLANFCKNVGLFFPTFGHTVYCADCIFFSRQKTEKGSNLVGRSFPITTLLETEDLIVCYFSGTFLGSRVDFLASFLRILSIQLLCRTFGFYLRTPKRGNHSLHTNRNA